MPCFVIIVILKYLGFKKFEKSENKTVSILDKIGIDIRYLLFQGIESLQPIPVKLYFNFRLFDLTEFIVWNISGIRKSEFVAKTQLLWIFLKHQSPEEWESEIFCNEYGNVYLGGVLRKEL